MTRLEANRELLKILSQLIEKHKDFRWNQLLLGYNFQSSHKDDFYEESEFTLDNVKDML